MKQNKSSKQVDKLEEIITDIQFLTEHADHNQPEIDRAAEQGIKAIRAYYKGLVPKELDATVDGLTINKANKTGWNLCREQIIKRIEES